MTANSTAMLQMAQLHIDEQIRSAERSRLARQVQAAERRSVRPVAGRRRGVRTRWIVPVSTAVGRPR
jgi:hypothetical protein